VRTENGDAIGLSFCSLAPEIAETADAERAQVMRVTGGEGLVVICVVLAVRAGLTEALPVHDHERDIAVAPGREAEHHAAVIGEVRASITDANAIGLVVLVLKAQLPLEHGIRNLELTDDRADAAAA